MVGGGRVLGGGGCAGRSGAASPCWNGPCPRCDAATVMTALAFGYLGNFHAVKMPATLLRNIPVAVPDDCT